MTNQLQGDTHINLHLVWPTYHKISALLAETDEDRSCQADGLFSIVNGMKVRGRAYVLKNLSDFKPTFHHMAMTFLNPAMKKLNTVSHIERLQFHAELENYISIHFPNEDEIDNRNEGHLGDLLADSFISLDDDRNSDSELMRYIHQPIQFRVDLKTWWFKNSTVYPRLFKLFMKLSCVQASSASSERAFSAGGNIVTEKRSLILPKHVNNLIVLRNKVYKL